jgi:hypothetical protein
MIGMKGKVKHGPDGGKRLFAASGVFARLPL